jgi:predicted transposase/invertase (TIGR01784 family)
MAIVEVQVVPQFFWDKRAVYYSSGVYFNQLQRGGAYVNLRRVISIQLLGTSLMQSSPWKSTPKEYIQHYKFVESMSIKIMATSWTRSSFFRFVLNVFPS